MVIAAVGRLGGEGSVGVSDWDSFEHDGLVWRRAPSPPTVYRVVNGTTSTVPLSPGFEGGAMHSVIAAGGGVVVVGQMHAAPQTLRRCGAESRYRSASSSPDAHPGCSIRSPPRFFTHVSVHELSEHVRELIADEVDKSDPRVPDAPKRDGRSLTPTRASMTATFTAADTSGGTRGFAVCAGMTTQQAPHEVREPRRAASTGSPRSRRPGPRRHDLWRGCDSIVRVRPSRLPPC